MFSKKITDVKKSTLKIQDAKKDLATRVKHLKIILDNVDHSEAKGLFEANFSHIFQILYDTFVLAEGNLKQRELSFHLVHKAHKEELEGALWILEQVLSLLPELIHKRWQIHSLGRILSKLLHPGNTSKLRQQAIKFFLMWYQALNENAPDQVHHMFASIVPGFVAKSAFPLQASGSVFHDSSAQNPVTPIELLPILPATSSDNVNKSYMDILLENMANTVVRLEWHDKASHHHRCFHFLLERFKIHYLPKLCPQFCQETSLYRPNLELPVVRKPEAETKYLTCRVILIKWVTHYTHQIKKQEYNSTNPPTTPASQTSNINDDESHDSSHPSLDSNMSMQTTKAPTDEELASQIVREVFWSSRDNVNFIHELYRQAFLLNFNYPLAIRKTIVMYKDLIQMNVPEVPPYMLEPMDESATNRHSEVEGFRPGRLRNDSYLGAIQKENLLVRAGLQNVLQLFMTHAANVFLLEVNTDVPKLLEEQTDTCKRVLNIYRYMVMHTRMDNATWEQLLVVLLQITSLVIGEAQPKIKQPALGRKLAPAIFQTLIVTWIKANLNVMISRDLWDRFLGVLTSLTHWEELIKEWAKTMETLTRVLARHVYNLDLTDLPLDRLSEQKNKKTRRGISKIEISSVGSAGGSHPVVARQDSNVPDGSIIAKLSKPGLARSFSETNLTKRRSSTRNQQRHPRRSHSLDNLRQQDTDSTDRTRSPSPAPSSGLESTSIKDTPIQLDVLASENASNEAGGEHRGVVCGGSVRGWLPDVAVILWRRMLGALGNVNKIADPNLHAQVFDYLVKLNSTLIKIKMNQGISIDNQSTPISPELVPPLTLILPWCFGALNLPQNYEAGKINALRLVCTITVHCNPQHRNYLPLFYRSLHIAFYGNSRAALNIALRHLGPRFLSLQLAGSSVLSFDLLHSCNTVLNSSDLSQATPRTEAVSILGGLLSSPHTNSMSVFQPELSIRLMPYPDKLKDHIVEILLRAGKREPTGMARCIAITALGHFVYRELMNQTFHPSVVDAMNVILWSLKFNHNTIAKLASNTLFLLCDHAEVLWNQYPRLADSVIRSICGALFLHLPTSKTAGDCDKALSTSLLLCLGEWCMRLGSNKLIRISEYGDTRGTSLLLLVFKVLHALIKGETSGFSVGSGQIPDDYEPSLFLDNLDSGRVQHSSPSQCRDAVVLCARTVLAHLVTHLGHFPMAIGAARLSSLVVEHDDVPHLNSDELSMDIFNSPNIQLFVLTPSVIASLVELPSLDLPGGGITAGLSTADRQVRVLLRDLSGKVSWDTSILYRTPEMCGGNQENEEKPCKDSMISSSGCKWGPMSMIQPESLMMPYPFNNLQQRAMRHRNANVLPSVENAAPDLDQLDDLLQYLGHTSPECLESADRKLNEAAPSPISRECEAEAIASVISQSNLELDAIRYAQSVDAMYDQPASRPSSRISGSISSSDFNINQHGLVDSVEQNAFQQCRLLFSQLGLAGWERRKQLHLLKKNERLLRELRNLDNQRCRETHKVAIIYVAPGQEDKNSILSNQGGSVAYEQFLAALAWEVELEGHTGFLGGLQRQGSTGLTAPYFATSFFEVIFHVATRMPGDTPEAVLSKTRHLGNDEVHIVWSEHGRDYRRDIIPTEFCDILITIYPLGNNLNRITLNCKPDVPCFGILFDEAIIENKILAGVIRTAVICASRAKRSTLPYYQQYYEERARSLDTVVTKHRDATTYEDFIARVYSPVMSLNSMSYSASAGGGDASSSSSNPSSLAAALLDSGQSLKTSQREHKFKDSRGVWFNHADNVESTSISPRPLKKLQTTLKNVPRRSMKQDQHHSSDNPPESPTQSMRKK
ncbi:PREDICTED: ral GTPase-activating protein subunit alpha-1 isoform X1 [Nicrophorus vespilloides]|uniref:Ral GTPase-activating protein subunit alpha-1 isoform X1 n=1 Tax=Nicrophorus vespilloides TaxID=110193 RepID=A0ABM1MMQ6_NICVS|nr:PREDICTED: ral GTPase-activating protein subunit alpha-1 isoform X1 [Nicrophorus vespilloides]